MNTHPIQVFDALDKVRDNQPATDKAIAALLATTSNDLIERKVGALLFEIESTEKYLPPAIMVAAAELHALLAGPGPDALDRRPGSLETVNDEGLHAKALVEAKARAVTVETAIRAEIAALPADVRQKAEYYDAKLADHRAEVFEAFERGKSEGIMRGQFDAINVLQRTPLKAIIWFRLKHWFNRDAGEPE